MKGDNACLYFLLFIEGISLIVGCWDKRRQYIQKNAWKKGIVSDFKVNHFMLIIYKHLKCKEGGNAYKKILSQEFIILKDERS